jgi:hypothetical protein
VGVEGAGFERHWGEAVAVNRVDYLVAYRHVIRLLGVYGALRRRNGSVAGGDAEEGTTEQGSTTQTRLLQKVAAGDSFVVPWFGHRV